MKKLLALFLVLMMCTCLFACGAGSTGENTQTEAQSSDDDVFERVQSMAENSVRAYVKYAYDYKDVSLTTYVDALSGSKYEVSGKVTITDKYGDSYTGNYDVLLTYDVFNDTLTVDSTDVDSLYRD